VNFPVDGKRKVNKPALVNRERTCSTAGNMIIDHLDALSVQRPERLIARKNKSQSFRATQVFDEWGREEKHRTGNGLAEKFWQRSDGHHRDVCGPAVPSIVVDLPLAHGEVITAHCIFSSLITFRIPIQFATVRCSRFPSDARRTWYRLVFLMKVIVRSPLSTGKVITDS
jgi:hypothetical protein